MATYNDLRDKVVLLTGGANGIGASTVRAFHAQGARMFFCDLDHDAGTRLAAALPGTSFTQVDLRREKQIVRWVADVRKTQRAIHVLVNNAAVDPRIPLQELDTKTIDDIFAINIRCFFLLARECVP